MIQEAEAGKLQGRWSWFLGIILFSFVVILAGCGKKTVATPAPPPPPPPAAPTASLIAMPGRIEVGQSSTLTWKTQTATEVTLDGEPVSANESKTVSPSESTTYLLIAKGPGGKQELAARITVTQPPPLPPAPTPSDEELFAQNMQNIYFDYDKYDVRSDQPSALDTNAKWLMQHPTVSFTVEGHCDERGSIEYNWELGDNRVNALTTALLQAGVATDLIHTMSYGKENPFCTEANEACWQQNRQGHFVYLK
jgi:peptidoglycan-associated lipoprotein